MTERQGRMEFSGFQCRPLQSTDLDMICSHRHEMFVEAGKNAQDLRVMTEHFRPWLKDRLEDSRYYGYALLDSDRPVASIGLMNLDWPPHPSHPDVNQRGYVLNLYVKPAYRRKGLASALMKLGADEFARRGITYAVLHATKSGKPVYEQFGWMGTSEMAKVIV